jgi:hypothetical protein
MGKTTYAWFLAEGMDEALGVVPLVLTAYPPVPQIQASSGCFPGRRFGIGKGSDKLGVCREGGVQRE